MAIIRGFRCLALIVIIAGLVGSAGITRQAGAQEAIAATVVEGTCDDPRDVAAELRDLTVAEGGALTSFTTIDIAIEDLTNSEFAVVIGDTSEPTACGEIVGEGTDIYISLSAQGDSTTGGIAWFHARDERTQVSLFLGEGLGGDGTTDADNEPDGDGPPEPPIDETPDPSENEVTYTSPNFGYTVTYDADFWTVTADESFPDTAGPGDYFALWNDNIIQVDFIGLSGSQVDAVGYVNNWTNNLMNDPSFISTAIRLDDEGHEIRGGNAQRAYVALDFESEVEGGNVIHNTYYLVAFHMGDSEEIVIMNFQTTQEDFDRWQPYREQLEAGMTFPE